MMKKTLTMIIAATMMASATAALAADVDTTVISQTAPVGSVEEMVNNYMGKVVSFDKNILTVDVQTEDDIYQTSFGVSDETKIIDSKGNEVKELKAGDMVTVSSTSALLTKDIKSASKVVLELDTTETSNDEHILNHINYSGKVTKLENGVMTVDVATEDGTYSADFAVTSTTLVVDAKGTKTEVKVGDAILFASTAELLTKDIKPIDILVVNPGMTNIYVDTFNKSELGFINAHKDLIIADDDSYDKYDNQVLAVIYDIATMSLPARTNPVAVISLDAPAGNNDGNTSSNEKVSIAFKVGDSTLKVNGEDISVETPYIVGSGVTLVPARVISEAFGAKVTWEKDLVKIVINEDEDAIMLHIDSKEALVNGYDKTLEEAPELTESGTTMVPLRFISEALGATVTYDEATQEITVAK